MTVSTRVTAMVLAGSALMSLPLFQYPLRQVSRFLRSKKDEFTRTPRCPVLSTLAYIQLLCPLDQTLRSFVRRNSYSKSANLLFEPLKFQLQLKDLPPPSSQNLSNPTPAVISVRMNPGCTILMTTSSSFRSKLSSLPTMFNADFEA